MFDHRLLFYFYTFYDYFFAFSNINLLIRRLITVVFKFKLNPKWLEIFFVNAGKRYLFWFSWNLDEQNIHVASGWVYFESITRSKLWVISYFYAIFEVSKYFDQKSLKRSTVFDPVGCFSWLYLNKQFSIFYWIFQPFWEKFCNFIGHWFWLKCYFGVYGPGN